jgi:hypothetical protein
LDDILIAAGEDEAGEVKGIETEDDGSSGEGYYTIAQPEVGIWSGSFFNAIDDEVREDLTLLGREVEVGFDAGEGDADGIGRRETEVELEEFRERVAFEIAVVNTDKGRTVDFIEIVAPCVSGVLISRESGAEVDSDSEDVDIGFIFFLCSVEADTDRTLLPIFARRTNSVAIISVFVKNFVFVHKFTSKIVRIIAFERM